MRYSSLKELIIEQFINYNRYDKPFIHVPISYTQLVSQCHMIMTLAMVFSFAIKLVEVLLLTRLMYLGGNINIPLFKLHCVVKIFANEKEKNSD